VRSLSTLALTGCRKVAGKSLVTLVGRNRPAHKTAASPLSVALVTIQVDYVFVLPRFFRSRLFLLG